MSDMTVEPPTVAGEHKATVRGVYQHIAAEYDERIPGTGPVDSRFTQSEHDFVFSKVQAGHRVLDLGCGTGRFTVPMAVLGAEVTGLDISTAMLDEARRKLKVQNVEAKLYEGDMAALPFADDSFEIITSMLALMHIPVEDRAKVFAEAARVLRPGGRMIIGVKNSIFERFIAADRFATVDITDVGANELHFTRTRSGEEFVAPWYSFSPDELAVLFATAGMIVTHLRGNSTLSAWLADEVLNDAGVSAVVRAVEDKLADIPPFNHLGYHLLVEAVKPAR